MHLDRGFSVILHVSEKSSYLSSSYQFTHLLVDKLCVELRYKNKIPQGSDLQKVIWQCLSCCVFKISICEYEASDGISDVHGM